MQPASRVCALDRQLVAAWARRASDTPLRTPDEAFARVHALLKPGGRLFLSTLNRTPKAFALGIVGAEYVLGLLPRGTHRYERFLKPSELRRALRDLGFDGIEFEGLKYDPFTRHVERNQDLSVNYLVAAVRSC